MRKTTTVKTTTTSKKITSAKASYYRAGLEGRKTASGERYHSRDHTAASNTLPLGTEAKITNLRTGKSVEVKVTDRGSHRRGRNIDLSRSAGEEIGLTHKEGAVPVTIEVIRKPGEAAAEHSR